MEILDKEFERIQQLSFFDIKRIPTMLKAGCEWLMLRDEDKKYTHSPIITRFHTSRYAANKKGCESPIIGWELIKKNKDLFEKLFNNRLKYSSEHWNDETGFDNSVYYTGMNSMGLFPTVGYFKPYLAKYLVNKYLSDCEIIFDPFSGFSGRMLGTLATGRKYIGSDISLTHIMESEEIYDFLREFDGTLPEAILEEVDVRLSSTDGYNWGLITCPPYEDKETYLYVNNGGIYNCDEWIDIVLKNHICKRYVFIVDDKIEKYKSYIKEEIVNQSHFGTNKEYVILIDRNELTQIR